MASYFTANRPASARCSKISAGLSNFALMN
jgi:hypothetical protein